MTGTILRLKFKAKVEVEKNAGFYLFILKNLQNDPNLILYLSLNILLQKLRQSVHIMHAAFLIK